MPAEPTRRTRTSRRFAWRIVNERDQPGRPDLGRRAALGGRDLSGRRALPRGARRARRSARRPSAGSTCTRPEFDGTVGIARRPARIRGAGASATALLTADLGPARGRPARPRSTSRRRRHGPRHSPSSSTAGSPSTTARRLVRLDARGPGAAGRSTRPTASTLTTLARAAGPRRRRPRGRRRGVPGHPRRRRADRRRRRSRSSGPGTSTGRRSRRRLHDRARRRDRAGRRLREPAARPGLDDRGLSRHDRGRAGRGADAAWRGP